MLKNIVDENGNISRQCTICNQYLPLDCFYQKPATDYYDSYCKECRAENKKRYEFSQRSNAGEEHEQIVVDFLRAMGIYAAPGKHNSIVRFLDVVAWGCVRIEVKLGEEHNDSGWKFRFTPRQVKYGLSADIVVLICPYPDDWEFYVFPSGNQIFYKSNDLRPAVYWMPGSRSARIRVTDSMMRPYQDNWHLIEELRQKFMQQMIDGIYTEERTAKPDRRQGKLF